MSEFAHYDELAYILNRYSGVIPVVPVFRLASASPNDAASNIFRPTLTPHGTRFIKHDDCTEFLIYTGAASIEVDQDQRASCSLFAGGGVAGQLSFRLEERGPTGIAYALTKERAELRAVIAALQWRSWNKAEGFKSVVIGISSQYVAEGVAQCCDNWARNGWLTADGSTVTVVPNEDLWKLLLAEISLVQEYDGLRVRLFRIPKHQAVEQAAIEATRKEANEQFWLIRRY